MSMTMPGPGLTDGVLLRRVWAWCIDIVLVAVLVGALFVLLAILGLATLGLGWGLLPILPVVPVLYHVLFVAGSRAATPGQSLMGLVVVRDRDLGRPEFLQAVIFTAGLYLTLSVGFWPLLVAAITDRHRALHDMASGLVVVHREALTGAHGFANMRPGMPYA